MLEAVGYAAEFILQFIFSQESAPFYIGLPGTVGEFGICLWLLVAVCVWNKEYAAGIFKSQHCLLSWCKVKDSLVVSAITAFWQ